VIRPDSEKRRGRPAPNAGLLTSGYPLRLGVRRA